MSLNSNYSYQERNLKSLNPAFHYAAGTPTVNNLVTPKNLTSNNPNKNQPQRIDRSKPVTCNPIHAYKDEQESYDGGKLDKFVEFDGRNSTGCQKTPTDNQVMDYFDGNTVTALWNYAQHFAMSDNFRGSTFGQSTPGHINLISGNTYGAECLQHNATCFVPGTGKVGKVRDWEQEIKDNF